MKVLFVGKKVSEKNSFTSGKIVCFLGNAGFFTDSVQFSSVAHSCLTLWDPIDCSVPGFPVHHQLLEFAQTQVYRVSDVIQPSHPLSPLSPPAFKLSHPMSQLFAWGGQSIGFSASASILSMNIQDWFPLGLTGLFIRFVYVVRGHQLAVKSRTEPCSLQSKGLSGVFSNTTLHFPFSSVLAVANLLSL